MSKRLWMLAGLAVLLMLALSAYRKSGALGASTGRSLAANPTTTPTMQTSTAGPSALPQTIERPALEAASRDPFVATPVPQPAPVALPVAPVVLAPPPPTPPPLNLRFAGRMTGPDGAAQVFVLLGETSLSASIGQTLPNGYRVEAITARAIELSYPSLNSTARLDLPDPPQHEIR
ncbi:hypothetical protein [Rhodoferax sp.]|uniref:hypothetical protein n=1 Tax=Rhodoferax sp. TaxID=50421 RepID=UPI00274858DB|nr:hypothetical protein [Rhodoferax sp.]